jgi:predicted phage-related endonuclease
MSSLFADLLAIRASITAQETASERLRQTLQQAMGDATEALFETGKVTFRRTRDSIELDVERLRTDYPQLADRYTAHKPGSRRFRIGD